MGNTAKLDGFRPPSFEVHFGGKRIRYRAKTTAGPLKIPDARVFTDILIRVIDGQDWQTAIFDRNVLQARSTETARRLARLIRSRLALMDVELWRLVRDGDGDTATHVEHAVEPTARKVQLNAERLDPWVAEWERTRRPGVRQGPSWLT